MADSIKKDLADATLVESMKGSDQVFIEQSSGINRISLTDLMKSAGETKASLESYAFYLDVNISSSKGASYIDSGGSALMKSLWLSEFFGALMDKQGHYTKLNPNDFRYTADGEKVLDIVRDETNKTITYTIADAYKNAQWMGIGPDTYEYADPDVVGRVWLSLMPIPGGRHIGRAKGGMFKINLSGGTAYSKPGVTTLGDSQNVMTFFDAAQKYSKNYGLAGRNLFGKILLYYMFAKYGYRDSQGCSASDGTKIWGVGLDGTETTTQTDRWQKFVKQRSILTGATLGLGIADGNAAVWDGDGNVCHSVKVGPWENPWGQEWEDDGHACSVGSTVYVWDGLFIPRGTPTADSFANIDHYTLTRQTSDIDNNIKMFIDAKNNRVAMYPVGSMSGVAYHDYVWNNSTGQLWVAGGSSHNGSNCGLGCSPSDNAWSSSASYISARLEYFGDIEEVSSAKLKEYLAAA